MQAVEACRTTRVTVRDGSIQAEYAGHDGSPAVRAGRTPWNTPGRYARGYSAACRISLRGSTACSAPISAAIIASVWKGVAQSRSRSVPRGTVG